MSRASSGPLSPALLVSVLALTLALGAALGGAAYAVASLPHHSVGPAQLKKNAVTSKAVRNGSLKAKDFAKGQLPGAVLVKNVGEPSTTITAKLGEPETVVSSMALPKGTYYVRANGYAINTDGVLLGDLRCYLRSSGTVLATGTAGIYVPIEPNAGTNANRGFFSLDTAFRLGAPGTVRVECSKGTAAQAIQAGASLAALETGSVTSVP